MGYGILGAAALVALGVGAMLRAEGTLTAAMVVHASLMIAAWAVLLPFGGIVARYSKITARQNDPDAVENLSWFHWHRVLQYAGLAVATAAVLVILSETGGRFETWHGRLGMATMGLGWLQLASTWLRGSKGGPTDKRARRDDPATWRGDHYDMTARRRAFEAWHKRVGWIILILAEATILFGIVLVGAPAWLLATVGALQAAALLGVIDGRLRGRWVDTYHALWGPDPIHPGNRQVSAAPSRPHRWRSRR